MRAQTRRAQRRRPGARPQRVNPHAASAAPPQRRAAAARKPARGERSDAAPPQSRRQTIGLDCWNSKPFRAAPKARPPAQQGSAAIRTRPHRERSAAATARRPARGKRSDAAPAAKQAAKAARKRPIQNPSMPRQRRGPLRSRAARQFAPTPAARPNLSPASSQKPRGSPETAAKHSAPKRARRALAHSFRAGRKISNAADYSLFRASTHNLQTHRKAAACKPAHGERSVAATARGRSA